MGRIHGDHATSPVYPGVSQHGSGSSQSAQPGDRIGMDATPRGGTRSSPPVAGDHRPVRDLAYSKAPSVLCSSVGTQSSRGRCIPPALGQPSGVCLSSHSYHKESSSQTESLSQLRSDSHRPLLASKGMVSRSAGTSVGHSNRTTRTSRSAATTSFPSVSRKSPYASSDCMATLERFASQAGFSETVAGQLALCRRNSTRLNYQARWERFRKWCRDFNHRSSEPTIPKIAKFFTFLFKRRRLLYRLSKATERCFRLCLSSVFQRFHRHLFSRTWCAPLRSQLLAHYIIRLHGIWTRFWSTCQAPLFEPLAEASFRNKTRKALFLLAMATTKRIGELQALSFSVSHRGDDLVLHYDPFFSGKNRISVKTPSQISHSPVSGGLCRRPARTGSLPSSRY